MTDLIGGFLNIHPGEKLRHWHSCEVYGILTET